MPPTPAPADIVPDARIALNDLATLTILAGHPRWSRQVADLVARVDKAIDRLEHLQGLREIQTLRVRGS